MNTNRGPKNKGTTSKGGIRVRTMAFRLGDDIEAAGRAFMEGLVRGVAVHQAG